MIAKVKELLEDMIVINGLMIMSKMYQEWPQNFKRWWA